MLVAAGGSSVEFQLQTVSLAPGGETRGGNSSTVSARPVVLHPRAAFGHFPCSSSQENALLFAKHLLGQHPADSDAEWARSVIRPQDYVPSSPKMRELRARFDIQPERQGDPNAPGRMPKE